MRRIPMPFKCSTTKSLAHISHIIVTFILLNRPVGFVFQNKSIRILNRNKAKAETIVTYVLTSVSALP